MDGVREKNGPHSVELSPSEPLSLPHCPFLLTSTSSLCYLFSLLNWSFILLFFSHSVHSPSLLFFSHSLHSPSLTCSACADQSLLSSTSLAPPLAQEISPCPSFNSLNHSNIHSVLPPPMKPDSRSSSFIIEFNEEYSRYVFSEEDWLS